MKFKTVGRNGRLFLFFLLAGFLTDFSVWMLFEFGYHGHVSRLVFDVYSLVEAAFYFWFVLDVTESVPLKKWSKMLLCTLPFFWTFCIFMYPSLQDNQPSGSALFVPWYEVVGAFLAGFALLLQSEKEQNLLSTPAFWFLSGIFFYSFCTFFIMDFLGSGILKHIWFMNNIINLISYVFFTIGFRVFQRGPA